MNLVEREDVADFDVAETRDSENVTRSKDVFPAHKVCNDVVRGLGTDEFECGSGGPGLRVHSATQRGDWRDCE